MPQEEQQILASINQKKLTGYEFIYKKYYAVLCSFCTRFSIQNANAEDIVQDVILSLWKSDSKFNSFKALASYLYNSVRNASLNALRNSKMSMADVSNEHFQSLMTDNKSILDLMIEEEYFRQIHIAIRSLTPERKRIILLFMKGLTNKEIAERIGISINTVKTLKIKAYRDLREKLKLPALLLLMFISL